MENKTLSKTRELVKLPPSEQHKVIHGNCDYLAIWLLLRSLDGLIYSKCLNMIFQMPPHHWQTLMVTTKNPANQGQFLT